MRDQTRNIETFKVGTGVRMNEFDFHRHQEEMREHHGEAPDHVAAKSETKAEKLTRLTRQAHDKVLKRKKRR